MDESIIISNPGEAYKDYIRDEMLTIKDKVGHSSVLNNMCDILVSEKYAMMRNEFRDGFIKFDSAYSPYRSQRDAWDYNDCKGSLIDITIFAEQPVIQVSGIKNNAIMTNYRYAFEKELVWSDNSSVLNNPYTRKLICPDLEITVLCAEDVKKIGAEIIKFYERHGWRAGILEKDVHKEEISSEEISIFDIPIVKDYEITLNSPRDTAAETEFRIENDHKVQREVKVYDPSMLVNLAKKAKERQLDYGYDSINLYYRV